MCMCMLQVFGFEALGGQLQGTEPEAWSFFGGRGTDEGLRKGVYCNARPLEEIAVGKAVNVVGVVGTRESIRSRLQRESFTVEVKSSRLRSIVVDATPKVRQSGLVIVVLERCKRCDLDWNCTRTWTTACSGDDAQ